MYRVELYLTMTKNKQLLLNITSSLLTFIVGLGVNFFLTPFIVKHLGVEAYGFVNLSNNIISYAGLITVALNAMASRFIAISYCKGNIDEACKYLSSVFYSNMILVVGVFVFFLFSVIWLEYMIDIPSKLVFDVKMLFSFLALSNMFTIQFSVYGVSPYIKNRLELASLRSIISSIIRCIVLIFCFSLLVPHVWYVGLSGLICSLYIIITNKKIYKKITPDLRINIKYYDWGKVKELLLSGLWNLLVRLGEILGVGMDLLMANVFLGPSAMGVLSLSKAMPTIIKAMFQSFAGSYSPLLLQYYAEKNEQILINELQRSIRLFTLFASVPLCIIYILGEDFYSLWIPSQDAHHLYYLTLLGTIYMFVGLPLENLWNIFTISNKVKIASIAEISTYGLTFLTMVVSMCFVKSIELKLIILAASRSFWCLLQAIFFIPIGVSYCLKISSKLFYKDLVKGFCSLLFTIALLKFTYNYINLNIESWGELIVYCCLISILSILTISPLVLNKHDKTYLKCKFNDIFKKIQLLWK